MKFQSYQPTFFLSVCRLYFLLSHFLVLHKKQTSLIMVNQIFQFFYWLNLEYFHPKISTIDFLLQQRRYVFYQFQNVLFWLKWIIFYALLTGSNKWLQYNVTRVTNLCWYLIAWSLNLIITRALFRATRGLCTLNLFYYISFE